METEELIKLWKTLAENKLIDNDLAKENIAQIISKKRNGIIHKIKNKSKVEYYIYLIGLIFIPSAALFVHFVLHHPMPNMNLRSYIGTGFAEIFFIYMFGCAVKSLKFLDFSFNTGSIKDSLERVKSYFESYLKKAYWVTLLFGFCFLIFVFIDFLVILGGIGKLNFSQGGFNVFGSYFSILIFIIIITWPFILNFDFKLRYSSLLNDINQTIDELEKEE